MAIAPLWPDGAQAACRTLSGIPPADWYPAYLDLVAAIRIGMLQDMRSFDPIDRWRGDAHRMLLRNPYADIGLTCLYGQAAVWIAERINRDYRIRCEWSDVSGPAHRWLASIALTFEADAARLGFAPIHIILRSALRSGDDIASTHRASLAKSDSEIRPEDRLASGQAPGPRHEQQIIIEERIGQAAGDPAEKEHRYRDASHDVAHPPTGRDKDMGMEM